MNCPVTPAFSNVTASAPAMEATVNEKASGNPTWGSPRLLKTMRSMALALNCVTFCHFTEM
jgi:hypothetical protein